MRLPQRPSVLLLLQVAVRLCEAYKQQYQAAAQQLSAEGDKVRLQVTTHLPARFRHQSRSELAPPERCRSIGHVLQMTATLCCS
jgi:hypothetical protein